MPRPVDIEARAQRRAQILDAVETLVASEGVAALTMQRIIAAGGVSAGTVYHHFSGKDEILGALVERQDQGTQELIDALEKGYTVRDVLKHSADEILTFLCDPARARLNIELSIAARGAVPWAEKLRRQDKRLADALRTAIERDVGKRRLARKTDPDTCTRLIFALWEGLISQAAHAPFTDRAALRRHYLDAVLGVFHR